MSMTTARASLLALTLLAAPLTLLDAGSRNRTSEFHGFISIRPRLSRCHADLAAQVALPCLRKKNDILDTRASVSLAPAVNFSRPNGRPKAGGRLADWQIEWHGMLTLQQNASRVHGRQSNSKNPHSSNAYTCTPGHHIAWGLQTNQ